MKNDHDETFNDYRRKGFAERSGFGDKPALLIIDMIKGFTDPDSPLGSDLSQQLRVTRELMDACREKGFPVVFTTVVYEPDFHQAPVFIKKVPSLKLLVRGSDAVEVDPSIQPAPEERVFEKQYASAFFGTDLNAYFKERGVDTVLITGCTTSGCVRASAIDSLQNDYLTIVVEEGVGDRAEGPHRANLFDIDAKYADVVSHADTLAYLGKLAASMEQPAPGAN